MTTRLLVVLAMLFAISAPARADEEDDPPKAKKAADDEEAPPRKAKKADVDDEEAPRKKAKKADEEDDAPAKKPSKGSKSAAVEASSAGELVQVGGPKARVTLPGGKLLFNVIVESNLAKSAAGKPISVAPDLWFGVADRMTFGVYHSGRAATGFLSGFGTGLCFRGKMGPCALGLGDVYTFAGSEARIALTEGGFAVGLVLGAQARAFDPKLVLSGKGGFIARISGKRLAIELAPIVLVGITQRKVGGMDFNRDELAVPVTIYLRFAQSFSLALQGGIASTLKKFGDNYRVPAAAGIAWWLTPHVSFDVAFGLAAVADKDDMTKAFDQRSITAGLGYAL